MQKKCNIYYPDDINNLKKIKCNNFFINDLSNIKKFSVMNISRKFKFNNQIIKTYNYDFINLSFDKLIIKISKNNNFFNININSYVFINELILSCNKITKTNISINYLFNNYDINKSVINLLNINNNLLKIKYLNCCDINILNVNNIIYDMQYTNIKCYNINTSYNYFKYQLNNNIHFINTKIFICNIIISDNDELFDMNLLFYDLHNFFIKYQKTLIDTLNIVNIYYNDYYLIINFNKKNILTNIEYEIFDKYNNFFNINK